MSRENKKRLEIKQEMIQKRQVVQVYPTQLEISRTEHSTNRGNSLDELLRSAAEQELSQYSQRPPREPTQKCLEHQIPNIVGYYRRLDNRSPSEAIMLKYLDGTRLLTTGILYSTPSEEYMERWEPVTSIDLAAMRQKVLNATQSDPIFDVTDNRIFISVLDAAIVQEKLHRMMEETGARPFVFAGAGSDASTLVNFPAEAGDYLTPEELQLAENLILQQASADGQPVQETVPEAQELEEEPEYDPTEDMEPELCM